MKLSELNSFRNSANSPSKLSELDPALVTLNGFVCVNVTGEEAVSFLQGQFTNDISNLENGVCLLNGYCNPKGRALAVTWLLKKEDGCFLLVPHDIAEGFIKRLQMFKMRAKATIEVESNLAFLGSINPPKPIVSLCGSTSYWELDNNRSVISVNADEKDDLVSQIGLPLVDQDYWNLGQILAGEPMVYANTVEALIPQHMNLDLVNGVSFTKGCYPGQEIIARLRYLGKLKQRMVIGRCNGSEDQAPGNPVFTQEKGEQKAGVIVDAVNVGEFQYLSVNISASHIDDGDIHIGSQHGTVLERIPVPYDITLEKNG